LAEEAIARFTVSNDNGVPMGLTAVSWVAYYSFDGPRITGGNSVTDANGILSVSVVGAAGDQVMIVIRRIFNRVRLD
jgi:hypothetical protein